MGSVVDVVVLSRSAGPLDPRVQRGLDRQRAVRVVVHRIVGASRPDDLHRYMTIARARNAGKRCGAAPWLLFLDDDVVLDDACIAQLLGELRRRPAYAAIGADYLGERRAGGGAEHVTMGATLFRREALDEITFRYGDDRCECQCCCDDLRQRLWGVDYSSVARAQHLTGESRPVAPPCPPQLERENSVGLPTKSRPFSAVRPSVCLVACYLGPLPAWFNHYLLSCRFNPSIDFLVFSDQRYDGALPPNVRMAYVDRQRLRMQVADQLGIEADLTRAYKLCDFKPTFGHLFADHLEAWDYWGYTDLDVVYGDLRYFLTKARLSRYDVFSARREYLAGHFTLFRNSDRLRTLYRRSADYRRTLASPQSFSFDECGDQWVRQLQGKPLVEGACESMTHIVQRLAAQQALAVRMAPLAEEWPELRREDDWHFQWRRGRLWRTDEGREAMYLHFAAFRRRPGFGAHGGAMDEGFDVTPDGFHAAGRAGMRLPRDRWRRPTRPGVLHAE